MTIGALSYATSLFEEMKRRRAVCSAKIQIFVNLTLPVRFAYAKDRAYFAIACDEEACYHYGEKRSWYSQDWIAAKAFLIALLTARIPEWFVDDWFVQPNEVHTKSVS